MIRQLAVTIALSILGACGAPGPGEPTAPEPNAQQPAPNADPRPTNTPQKRYIRFGFEQENLREYTFEWHYNLKKDTRYGNGLQDSFDYESDGPGIAKVDIYALEKHYDVRMRCLILYRSTPDEDWRIAAESEGTRECHASVAIS